MKIAIEGMDGVGKTTIAKIMAEKYGYKYLEKPLEELMNIGVIDGRTNLKMICENIYSLNDERLKAWFFGLGNLYSFINYRNEDLILDRHFASNYFWNGSDRTKEIFRLMIDYISFPDITILLVASTKTRLSRIKQRDKNDYDLIDIEKHVYGYDKMISFLEEFNIPYTIVDTDDKSIDEVLELVDEIIINKIKEKNNIKKHIRINEDCN